MTCFLELIKQNLLFSVDVLDKWAEYKIVGKFTTEMSAAAELYNTGKNNFKILFKS